MLVFQIDKRLCLEHRNAVGQVKKGFVKKFQLFLVSVKHVQYRTEYRCLRELWQSEEIREEKDVRVSKKSKKSRMAENQDACIV